MAMTLNSPALGCLAVDEAVPAAAGEADLILPRSGILL